MAKRSKLDAVRLYNKCFRATVDVESEQKPFWEVYADADGMQLKCALILDNIVTSDDILRAVLVERMCNAF